MKMTFGNTLPLQIIVEGIWRAPDRGFTLIPVQCTIALKNALHYIHSELHEQPAPNFMKELYIRGRIYGYRFRSVGDLKAKPIDKYRGKCIEGRVFQVMIGNILSFDIALYSYRKELPFIKDDIVMNKEIYKTVAFLKRTKLEY